MRGPDLVGRKERGKVREMIEVEVKATGRSDLDSPTARTIAPLIRQWLTEQGYGHVAVSVVLDGRRARGRTTD